MRSLTIHDWLNVTTFEFKKNYIKSITYLYSIQIMNAKVHWSFISYANEDPIKISYIYIYYLFIVSMSDDYGYTYLIPYHLL